MLMSEVGCAVISSECPGILRTCLAQESDWRPCMSPWSQFRSMEILLCSKETLLNRFCRGLVDEIEWAIKKVDPKKTIQVGSYRIGPDGSQKTNEILYARSETHLSEILEDVCSNLDDYSLYEDPETQKKTYMRFAPRESEKMSSVDFNNFKFDPENSKSLKFACETIVEEYEDEIISLFTHETDQVADMLCIEKSEFCEPSQASPHTDL
uniref:Canopy FGF signaling regulator 1 n=1 Tax=Callorhinchus milii TaxID=7868 RepID=A0A4W3I3E5_CALMI|eukprot:gi/632979529/ref/XP_007906521.1/ PREDICTED: protein canopy homolog 1 [Callorhinchus milii]